MFRLIASYPKSGNTMVRIMFAHYLRGNTNLNTVGFPIFNSVAHFPLGNPGNRHRIEPFKRIIYSKTHETAHPFFGNCVSHALVIIRNPFDIVPSYARHMSIDLDSAIVRLGSARNHLRGTDKIYPQHISDWSTHVSSWLNQTNFPCHFVRYESLVSNPEESYRSILKFFKIPMMTEKFGASLIFSTFSNVKKLEEEMLEREKAALKAGEITAKQLEQYPIHFKETRGSTGRFFNVGRAGTGKLVLSKDQINRIYKRHQKVIDLLGYAP